jgi:hypothetical protein
MKSPTQLHLHRAESGSTIICAICTILIISFIGANVLLNCTTRYNVTAKQVKAWKEALYAAESGGDIGFAEVRKVVSNPSAAFPSSKWNSPASPAPTPGPSYVAGLSYSTKTPTPSFGQFGQANSLSTSVTVDSFSDPKGTVYYRIRAAGTATLLGLPRTGMDDRMDRTTRGDSLLRKIDFKYDHFRTTYGDGDLLPQTLSPQKTIQTTVPNPQVTRRIELIAVPQMASFTGALKVSSAFSGPGSAGQVDSFDSKNGAYPGASIAANPVPPSDPNYKYYSNSRNGDVSVGTATFAEGGPIYGNVTTNGGNVTHSGTNISGTIDNSVPFTLPPLVRPDTTSFITGSGSTLNLLPGTSPAAPAQYVYSSLSGGLTINGQTVAAGLPNAGMPAETYVTIVVGSGGSTGGDVGKVTIGAGVNAKIYFTGSLNVKARDLVNNNVDGAVGVYNADGTPSVDYSRAGHMQFYGISPTDGSMQSLAIAPPGNIWATIYAPSGVISLTGNPDWYGAVVAYSFTGNGNTGFHYDKQISGDGVATDYQIASYVEDIR